MVVYMKKKLGVLLCNIGTPDAPTISAVRRYLKEFLSDRRVIETTPILWQPILRLFILPFRPKKSASLYQKIWTEKGSPLLLHTLDIAEKLQSTLQQFDSDTLVTIGMRYGNPSIKSGLELLQANGVKQILVLPMFPQYSGTTTASTFDAVSDVLKSRRDIPDLRMIKHYFDNKSYIKTIRESILEHWQENGKKHLLFSFHGIPQRYADQGDPYAEQCKTTAERVAAELQLNETDWTLAFQSRLGPTKWLTPYTDKILKSLPKKGIEHVHVVCPGFPVDCLETLEEISIRGKEQFLGAGGKSFGYIPALNSTDMHITMLTEIIQKEIMGWD